MSHRSRPARLRKLALLPALFAVWPLAAAAQDGADLELGKQVFLEEAQPPCAVCHKLADAEAEGTIGPHLDQLMPTKERVLQALQSGPGAMPVYSDSLSEEQMEAVSEYVATVAGGS
ncbi:MAG TPA: cytochrome c [Afifellaceae bacterium]|nr:cytochrome c [Afifellaceae bacterium]